MAFLTLMYAKHRPLAWEANCSFLAGPHFSIVSVLLKYVPSPTYNECNDMTPKKAKLSAIFFFAKLKKKKLSDSFIESKL